jgi:hypothetical protein
MKKIYINMKNPYIKGVETVAEYNNRKEAITDLKEYRISDSYSFYYISQRCTNDWKERA